MGGQFFFKSYINQPNQGHQSWQSNSLAQAVVSPLELFNIFLLQPPLVIQSAGFRMSPTAWLWHSFEP